MTEASVVIGVIGRPHGVRGAVRTTATGATLGCLAAGDAVEARIGTGPPRRLVLAGGPARPSGPS